MTGWDDAALRTLTTTQEMRVAERRPDGTLRTPRIVWMVVVGDELYTRSVNGPQAAWFRGTRATGSGHLEAGGVDADVSFIDISPTDAVQADLDTAYQGKYGQVHPGPTAHITSDLARAATLKIIPQQTD